ncbi:hypothetical protein RYX45_01520 [Alkalihalophilus pseudofirmus]|uniref:Uncharacterized protein n=1 Tax=Alkalihalophilus pseudofirmus TaxID=79885 RepID=A0AAJ2KS28_ALKPS|nr:hypothetical protein [Alkalihalophilus pseudofirmus]MDV2883842.1 hypothetical protein [Alkalihalophilus pseudofirmus]
MIDIRDHGGSFGGGILKVGGYIRSSQLGVEELISKNIIRNGSSAVTASNTTMKNNYIYHYDAGTRLVSKYDSNGNILVSFSIMPSINDIFITFQFGQDDNLYSVYRANGDAGSYTVDRFNSDGQRDVNYRATYINSDHLRSVQIYDALYFCHSTGRISKLELDGTLTYTNASNTLDLLYGGVPETPGALFFGYNGNGSILKMSKSNGSRLWAWSNTNVGFSTYAYAPKAYNSQRNELIWGSLNGMLARTNAGSNIAGSFLLGSINTNSLSLQGKAISLNEDTTKIVVPFGGYSQGEGIDIYNSTNLNRDLRFAIPGSTGYMGNFTYFTEKDDFFYAENSNNDFKIGSIQRKIL